MKVIDLFCGCGGFSQGLKQAGYNIVQSYDNWDLAINVYKANFQHTLYNLDLGNIQDEDTNRMKEVKPDIIVGGPPCQDYSSAGNRDEKGGRADLTVDFANIVVKVKPKYFIMENVSDIRKYSTLGVAKDIFKEAGYGLSEVVLDASYYGVPQSRKRYFLVGEMNGNDEAITPYLKKGASTKKMTMRDYFGEKLGIDYYYRHPRSYNRRGIFSMDEPSPTIRGVNRPIPSEYKLHKGDMVTSLEGIRALTTLERSYVQTFPEDYKFEGTKTNLEQMIGNAVPVKLAEHVGNGLKNYIEDKKHNKEICEIQLSLLN